MIRLNCSSYTENRFEAAPWVSLDHFFPAVHLTMFPAILFSRQYSSRHLALVNSLLFKNDPLVLMWYIIRLYIIAWGPHGNEINVQKLLTLSSNLLREITKRDFFSLAGNIDVASFVQNEPRQIVKTLGLTISFTFLWKPRIDSNIVRLDY